MNYHAIRIVYDLPAIESYCYCYFLNFLVYKNTLHNIYDTNDSLVYKKSKLWKSGNDVSARYFYGCLFSLATFSYRKIFDYLGWNDIWSKCIYSRLQWYLFERISSMDCETCGRLRSIIVFEKCHIDYQTNSKLFNASE